VFLERGRVVFDQLRGGKQNCRPAHRIKQRKEEEDSDRLATAGCGANYKVWEIPSSKPHWCCTRRGRIHQEKRQKKTYMKNATANEPGTV